MPALFSLIELAPLQRGFLLIDHNSRAARSSHCGKNNVRIQMVKQQSLLLRWIEARPPFATVELTTCRWCVIPDRALAAPPSHVAEIVAVPVGLVRKHELDLPIVALARRNDDIELLIIFGTQNDPLTSAARCASVAWHSVAVSHLLAPCPKGSSCMRGSLRFAGQSWWRLTMHCGFVYD